MRTVGVLLFPGFEPLDAFGPVEAFAIAEIPDAGEGAPPPFRVLTVAEAIAPVAMRGGPRVVPDHDLASAPALDVLLVPGGPGTRREVKNAALVEFIRRQARQAQVVASICTGAALLGVAGLLSEREATTNRRAFDWVVSTCPGDIRWNRTARWVDQGPVVTSAGVSAGTDMALHLVARLIGSTAAEAAAKRMEYRWEREG
ncbi:DJ-1/PfpI family protein [Anaeromyxobacter paludicola]|uniref:ThiJ/PfpI family protein n=1 Tax=Anaeromyxobacter paludicola TaxID=2918171 RepID=A0ABN6N9Q5_9BACT|nr:DJ-1/PfpI family protein [Anaeromyxobacter paludicola]BDG09070.1 ThiJ/PfpI family protein [Anaeromyxobacter paludicola]